MAVMLPSVRLYPLPLLLGVLVLASAEDPAEAEAPVWSPVESLPHEVGDWSLQADGSCNRGEEFHGCLGLRVDGSAVGGAKLELRAADEELRYAGKAQGLDIERWYRVDAAQGWLRVLDVFANSGKEAKTVTVAYPLRTRYGRLQAMQGLGEPPFAVGMGGMPVVPAGATGVHLTGQQDQIAIAIGNTRSTCLPALQANRNGIELRFRLTVPAGGRAALLIALYGPESINLVGAHMQSRPAPELRVPTELLPILVNVPLSLPGSGVAVSSAPQEAVAARLEAWGAPLPDTKEDQVAFDRHGICRGSLAIAEPLRLGHASGERTFAPESIAALRCEGGEVVLVIDVHGQCWRGPLLGEPSWVLTAVGFGTQALRLRELPPGAWVARGGVIAQVPKALPTGGSVATAAGESFWLTAVDDGVIALSTPWGAANPRLSAIARIDTANEPYVHLAVALRDGSVLPGFAAAAGVTVTELGGTRLALPLAEVTALSCQTRLETGWSRSADAGEEARLNLDESLPAWEAELPLGELVKTFSERADLAVALGETARIYAPVSVALACGAGPRRAQLASLVVATGLHPVLTAAGFVLEETAPTGTAASSTTTGAQPSTLLLRDERWRLLAAVARPLPVVDAVLGRPVDTVGGALSYRYDDEQWTVRSEDGSTRPVQWTTDAIEATVGGEKLVIPLSHLAGVYLPGADVPVEGEGPPAVPAGKAPDEGQSRNEDQIQEVQPGGFVGIGVGGGAGAAP